MLMKILFVTSKFGPYLFQICKFGKSFETDETRFDNTKKKDGVKKTLHPVLPTKPLAHARIRSRIRSEKKRIISPALQIRIRILVGWIRIHKGKEDQEKKKKSRNVVFGLAVRSFLMAEGFSSGFDVLQ
jgi:hypothetical protein